MSPFLLWAGLALASPLPENAADPFKEADESALFRFDEQLVTIASRYAQNARKAPGIVTVITAEQIRERGLRTLSDALRALPGLYVWRSAEGRDLVSVRGVISSDNNKILLLLDGQPWYDGVYTHGFIDDYLPLSQVKQIEVIKGPGSAVYGTNAFTGAINVVTFTAEELQGARARATVGAYGRGEVSAIAGGTSKFAGQDTAATVWVRALGQSGDGLDVVPRGRADFVGNDPHRGLATGGRLRVGDLSVNVTHIDYAHAYLVSERDDPYDAAGKDLDQFGVYYRNTGIDARYRIKVSKALSLTPHGFSQSFDNPSAYFFTTPTTAVTDPDTGATTVQNHWVTVEAEKITRRWGLGLDLEAHPATGHALVAGIGVENTVVSSLVDMGFVDNTHEAQLWGGFAAYDGCGEPVGLRGGDPSCKKPALTNLFALAQYSWTISPAFELTAGARLDKRVPRNAGESASDAVFVPSISPRAGLLWLPNDRVTGRLLYGRAFRAPNVREILVRSEPDETGEYPFTTGNLNARPESIHTVESEVSVEAGDLDLRVDGSYSQLFNEIDKVFPGLYCNLPYRLHVVSGEAEVAVEKGPLQARAAYALTLANYGDLVGDTSGCPEVDWSARDLSGRSQYEFPPHMLKAQVRLAMGDRLSATLDGEVYSKRPRAAWSDSIAIPDGNAMALLHLSMLASRLGPGERVSVGVTGRNLTDARWSTGFYRDDAAEVSGDALRFPTPLQGEGRAVLGTLEVKL